MVAPKALRKVVASHTAASLALFVGALSIFNDAVAAVPSYMIFPANGTGWYNTTGSPFHTESGGIGKADDRNAQDLNKASDADKGQSVYAIADGFVERNISGWSGTTYGQLLLKHRNPDGSTYYCGYLHMKNITSLKDTQGAYIKAGTQIGIISNVNPSDPKMPNHLHFACYDWNGVKLVSKPLNLYQVTERPNLGIKGSVFINGNAVNMSPWSIFKNQQFSLSMTIRNYGSSAAYANFYVIMTRDQNGADYVGKVGDLSSCKKIASSGELRATYSKPYFTSPAGTYWLQVYHDDCTTGAAALKRVGGINPIAIKLK
jgi:murein DD-endopeptidase MepM/ murein hydrolase activator NlpD